MSHEEFANYLIKKYIGKIFEEYEDWLENHAVMDISPTPDGNDSKHPDGSPSTEEYTKEGLMATLGTDIAGKASEIRSFVRANVNDKEHKHLTKSAKNALLMLLDGRMLADVPDKEIVEWYENWVEKVK